MPVELVLALVGVFTLGLLVGVLFTGRLSKRSKWHITWSLDVGREATDEAGRRKQPPEAS